MKAVLEKQTHYFKYVDNGYDSGNVYGIAYWWNEYRAGAYFAGVQLPQHVTLSSVVVGIGAWRSEFSGGMVCNIHVEGSNDGINWYNLGIAGVTIGGCGTVQTLYCSGVVNPAWHFRFYAENYGVAGNDGLYVDYVRYIGSYTTPTEVQSGESYDFTVDTARAKLIADSRTNKYYALKSFEKGQYYGN